MKDFINEFSNEEIERIESLEDIGEIEAYLFVQETRGKLSYIDLSEPDIF